MRVERQWLLVRGRCAEVHVLDRGLRVGVHVSVRGLSVEAVPVGVSGAMRWWKTGLPVEPVPVGVVWGEQFPRILISSVKSFSFVGIGTLVPFFAGNPYGRGGTS